MCRSRHFFLCQAAVELLAAGIRLLLPLAVGLLVVVAAELHLLVAETVEVLRAAAHLGPVVVGLPLQAEVELRLP